MSEADPNEPALNDDGLHPSDLKVGAERAYRLSIIAYWALVRLKPAIRGFVSICRELRLDRIHTREGWYCFAD